MTDFEDVGTKIVALGQEPFLRFKSGVTQNSARKGLYCTSTTSEFSFTSSAPSRNAIIRMIDELAEPLIELQRAGVVVLFRPFTSKTAIGFGGGIRGPGLSRVPNSFPGFGSIRSFT
jgi:hypothetical protein